MAGGSGGQGGRLSGDEVTNRMGLATTLGRWDCLPGMPRVNAIGSNAREQLAAEYPLTRGIAMEICHVHNHIVILL